MTIDSPRVGEVEKAYKAFFASMPSTPSGVGTPSIRSGAQIYQDFMDSYHRRLRKAQAPPPGDAAGLLNNSRYHGRKTPLKGKGSPPPDNYEPQFHPSKRLVPGKSHVAVNDLLVHRPHNPMAMSMDSGLMALTLGQAKVRPESAHGGRPCLKLTENSFRSSMQGSGLSVITEVPVHRPIRKPGTAAPTGNTKARVLVLSEDVVPESWSQAVTPRDTHLSTTWDRQSLEVGASGLMAALERPMTAPARATDPAHFNEARRRYHETSTLNLDLFNYRHSGGICPDEYKLDGVRSPAPQLSSPNADAAREAFFASRLGYAQNRVRSKISAPTYA